jgi:hypothetical protein
VDHQNLLDVRHTGQCIVDILLERNGLAAGSAFFGGDHHAAIAVIDAAGGRVG